MPHQMVEIDRRALARGVAAAAATPLSSLVYGAAGSELSRHHVLVSARATKTRRVLRRPTGIRDIL